MATQADLQGRDATQAKTFTNWVNLHLGKSREPSKITDLDADIRDGKVLCLLAEVFVPKDTTLKFYTEKLNDLKRTQNNSMALERFEKDECALFNIHATSLASETPNLKLKMGLIFQLILRYSVSLQQADADADAETKRKQQSLAQLKQSLIDWVNQTISILSPAQRAEIRKLNGTDGDDVIQCSDLDNSWTDGNVLTALVIALHPEDRQEHGINKLNQSAANYADQGELAALTAVINRAQNNLTTPALMDPADMKNAPDANSILTYVSQFKNAIYVDDKEEEPVIEEVAIDWDEPTFLQIEVSALEANDLSTLDEQKDIIQTKLDEYKKNVDEQKVYKESCHRKAKRMELHLRRVTTIFANAEAAKAKDADATAKDAQKDEEIKNLQDENAQKDEALKAAQDELAKKDEELKAAQDAAAKKEEELAVIQKKLSQLEQRQNKIGELQKHLLSAAEISDEILADMEKE